MPIMNFKYFATASIASEQVVDNFPYRLTASKEAIAALRVSHPYLFQKDGVMKVVGWEPVKFSFMKSGEQFMTASFQFLGKDQALKVFQYLKTTGRFCYKNWV